ncbi:hypothetical protein B0H11DRAFT_2021843 [Mycena galericulata]|nr:hypothetical protein B0H11DRAFT_2021843 [Mycena galericulata]
MHPDSLALELWREIAAHIPCEDSPLNLKPWLAVGPLSSARNMHDAAFARIFREVSFVVYDTAAPVTERLSRLRERPACAAAVRCLDMCFQVSDLKLSLEEIDAEAEKMLEAGYRISVALTSSLEDFPLLQEFQWDDRSAISGGIPMNVEILTALRSFNPNLKKLVMGYMHAMGNTIDLGGFEHLVHLEFEGWTSAVAVLPNKLESVRFTLFPFPPSEYDLLAETLMRNASSLGEITIVSMRLPRNVWVLPSPYARLHTITLQEVTPPVATGLDFSNISTLRSLSLSEIHDLAVIEPLGICIRTPDTLKQFRLYNVSSSSATNSLLMGVPVAAIDTLSLQGVALNPADIAHIFGTQSPDSDGQRPSGPRVLELLDTDPFALSFSASRIFPVLQYLRCSINLAAPEAENHFNTLASFISRHAGTLESLELGVKWPQGLHPTLEMTERGGNDLDKNILASNLLSSLKEAVHLRDLEIDICALAPDALLFHELGDAILHIPSILLKCRFADLDLKENNEGVPADYLSFTENDLHLFFKFRALRRLELINLGSLCLERSAVEQLGRHMPKLIELQLSSNSCLTSWVIQRDGSGEFMNATCFNRFE